MNWGMVSAILLAIVIILLVIILLSKAKSKDKNKMESENGEAIISKKTMTKKKKIIYTIIGVILLIGIIGGGYVYSQYPPSPQKIFPQVKEMMNIKSFDLGAFLDKTYPDNGLFKKKNKEDKDELLSLIQNDLVNQLNNIKSKNPSLNLEITKVEVTNTYKSSSDYSDVNITVHNNGKTNVTYTKINLYFKDKSGNVIKSDWTNDSSTIKPNSSQVITKMVKSDGWDSVSAEIATD